MKPASLARPARALEPADPLRVWFRFVRLNRRVSAAMTRELKAVGLSLPQFDALSTLTEAEGLSQQELAQRLYVTKGNVSGLVDRLVGAGLVERRSPPGDRRSHALHLTPAGRDLAARGLAAQRTYVARTLGRLGAKELGELERLVLAWREAARAAEAVDPQPRPSAPAFGTPAPARAFARSGDAGMPIKIDAPDRPSPEGMTGEADWETLLQYTGEVTEEVIRSWWADLPPAALPRMAERLARLEREDPMLAGLIRRVTGVTGEGENRD